ncbi:hypothetical protein CHS0354_006213 [Potamilus streckersoni]|uniref:Uncharacterized protein n=1 Tax=Potamilus streckersoni TaxID=2493646 RepID=A0AAE0SRJ3_9BIVA|nr:hypothetical protein CHS0354_006213 [Potamilus streckersoni]
MELIRKLALKQQKLKRLNLNQCALLLPIGYIPNFTGISTEPGSGDQNVHHRLCSVTDLLRNDAVSAELPAVSSYRTTSAAINNTENNQSIHHH